MRCSSIIAFYGRLFFCVSIVVCGCGSPKPEPLSVGSAGDAAVSSVVPEVPGEKFIVLADLDPYFTGFLGYQAMAALAEDSLAEAIRLFDQIADTVSDIDVNPRARFMAVYLAERLGDSERALEELPGLAEELPLLRDLAWVRAAGSALRLGKCERAADLASMVDITGGFGPEALLIQSGALRAQSRFTEAAALYRRYLDSWPSGQRRYEAQAGLVDCLAKLVQDGAEDKKALAEEALAGIAYLRAQVPTSRWTVAAEEHEAALMKALGRKLPRSRREKPAAQKAYDQAVEWMDKMRNAQAERGFAKVVRLARSDGSLSCRARYYQGVVISRQRDHERAALKLDGVAEECGDPDIQVRALYKGGKAYHAAERYEDAIRLFGRVETDFAAHSFADDSRLLAARCYLALGDSVRFADMLVTLPDLYPNGDMRAEAMWILSKDALVAGNLVEAKERLIRYYQAFPKESGWYATGRSGYWRGRVEELLGETEHAAMRYEQVVAGCPLTYYMVLSYNRLAAIDPGRARVLMSELAPAGGTPEARFPASLLAEFQSLATGVELGRLGLITLARRSFDRLLAEPDLPPEVYLLTASILRNAGRYNDMDQFTSQAEKGWRQRYPSGHDLAFWHLAYPTAYEEDVTGAAVENDLDPSLIWAVMREESRFDPDIESWANAIGLMQLILPTAKRVGDGLGMRINRRSLKKPAVNIALGAKYLSHLKERFSGHPALMVAGYNAGEGAVIRWLKERPGLALDLFVEEIPYRQTRGYTKRVLSSLAAYRFLYGEGHQVLKLDLRLPTQ